MEKVKDERKAKLAAVTAGGWDLKAGHVLESVDKWKSKIMEERGCNSVIISRSSCVTSG